MLQKSPKSLAESMQQSATTRAELAPFLDRISVGDCVEELKRLPDRSVDLVILDPPYWKVVNEGWDFEWRTKNDYVEWCSKWLSEIARVIKLGGSVYLFGYTRNLVYLYPTLAELGFLFRQEIVVDKGRRSLAGRKTSTYKQFPNTTETVWFWIHDAKPFIRDFLKGRARALGLTSKDINSALEVKTNGGGVWSLYTGNNILAQVPTEEMWSRLQRVLEFDLPYGEIGQTFNTELGPTNVWTDIDFYREQRLHPTQKPLPLIERIIRASSSEGQVVLDPFIGSGTTAVAARGLNRHFIGIDKDASYVDAATERLGSTLS